MFVLLLHAADGSERCYYQTGTNAMDVISSLVAENVEGSSYPDVTVGGYTKGSLAGPNGEEALMTVVDTGP